MPAPSGTGTAAPQPQAQTFHKGLVSAPEMWNRTCVQAHPRVWNTSSTTRNHSTAPVHILSCTAALEQDVSQEKPHSCSQSPAGITCGGSTGRSRHTGISPGGNSLKSHPAGTDRRETTPLWQPQEPAGNLSWEQGQPQLLSTASMGHAAGGHSWHETCGTVPQHPPREAGGARGAPRHCRIQVHPSSTPLVRSLLAALL